MRDLDAKNALSDLERTRNLDNPFIWYKRMESIATATAQKALQTAGFQRPAAIGSGAGTASPLIAHGKWGTADDATPRHDRSWAAGGRERALISPIH